MQHESAACNAVSGAFRFLTAATRLLLLPSEGTDSGISVFTALVSEQVVLGFCVFCARKAIRCWLARGSHDDPTSYG